MFASVFVLQAQTKADAFIVKWQINKGDFRLPVDGIGRTYHMSVDWGDGSKKDITDMHNGIIKYSHYYKERGIYIIKITPLEDLDNDGKYETGFPYINMRDKAEASQRHGFMDVVQWGSSRWETMKDAFWECKYMDVTASDTPDLSIAKSTSGMFYGATELIGTKVFEDWDMSNIENMSWMFFKALIFNQDVGGWEVRNVTDMSSMFGFTRKFNRDLSRWNTSNVENMKQMFSTTEEFNNGAELGDMTKPLNWDVSSVEDMREMFSQAPNFNQYIGKWNTSKVTNMFAMFNDARSFNNGDVRGGSSKPMEWDVSSVTTMGRMFYIEKEKYSSFNQDISSWDVSSVTRTDNMLDGADVFNNGGQPLDWGSKTSKLTDMSSMFRSSAFNQDVSSWDVSNVRKMYSTFRYGVFDQDLSAWKIKSLTDAQNMFAGTKLSTANYDSLLISWNRQLVNGEANKRVKFDANESQYCEGEAARANLIANGWGDGKTGNNKPSDIWDKGKASPRTDFTFGEDVDLCFGDSIDLVLSGSEAGFLYYFYELSSDALLYDSVLGTGEALSFLVKPDDTSGYYVVAEDIISDREECLFADVDTVIVNIVQPGWGGSISPASKQVFSGRNSTELKLSGYKGSIIAWESSTDSFKTVATVIPNTVGLESYTALNLDADTYFRAVVKNGPCDTIYSDTAVLRVIPDDESFITRWEVTAGTELTLSVGAAYIYDFLIDWGEGDAVVFSGDASSLNGAIKHTYTGLGTDTVDVRIAPNVDLDGDGEYESGLPHIILSAQSRLLDVSQWGRSRWKDMSGSFSSCARLDVSASDTPDLRDVSSLASMFADCPKLVGTEVFGAWGVGNVQDMSYMFKGASSFSQDLGDWQISSLGTAAGMFEGAKLKLSHYDSLLIGWERQAAPQNVKFHGGASLYCDGESARANLIVGGWGDGVPTANADTDIIDGGRAELDDSFTFGKDSTICGNDTAVLRLSGSEQGIYYHLYDLETKAMIIDSVLGTGSPIDFFVSPTDTASYYVLADNPDAAGSSCHTVGIDTVTVNVYPISRGGRTLPAVHHLVSSTEPTVLSLRDHIGEVVRWESSNSLDFSSPTTISNSAGKNTITVSGISQPTYFRALLRSGTCDSAYSKPAELSLTPDGELFITKWVPAAPDYRITIPTYGGGYNYTVYWGDGNKDEHVASAVSHSYSSDDTVIIKIDVSFANDKSGKPITSFPRLYFYAMPDMQDKLVDIVQWGINRWTSMDSAFYGCSNLDVSAPDVPSFIARVGASAMFRGCRSLVGTSAFSSWDVIRLADMSGMFYGAVSFNMDISDWDVENVRDMNRMFYNAESYNNGGMPLAWMHVPLRSSPDMVSSTLNVADMSGMFAGATAFNQDINHWDVGNVRNMQAMFDGASSFDQALADWDVSQVDTMSQMFRNATAFDQDLASWQIAALDDAAAMFEGAKLSIANYDSLLISWNRQLEASLAKQNVKFHGGASRYCAGESARANLIVGGWGDGVQTANTANDIIDGGSSIPKDNYTFGNDTSTCFGTSLTLSLSGSEIGVYYHLYELDSEILILDSVMGTGSSIDFIINPDDTTSYYLLADNPEAQGSACHTLRIDTITVDVIPLSVGGNISPSETFVCFGDNTLSLTLNNNVGDVVRWESSVNADFSDSTLLAEKGASLSVDNLSQTTYYRVLVSSVTCDSAYSDTAVVIIYDAEAKDFYDTISYGEILTIYPLDSVDAYLATLNYIGEPRWGLVRMHLNERVSYEPDDDFLGTDSFRYYVTMNGACIDSAWVYVTTLCKPYRMPDLIMEVCLSDNTYNINLLEYMPYADIREVRVWDSNGEQIRNPREYPAAKLSYDNTTVFTYDYARTGYCSAAKPGKIYINSLSDNRYANFKHRKISMCGTYLKDGGYKLNPIIPYLSKSGEWLVSTPLVTGSNLDASQYFNDKDADGIIFDAIRFWDAVISDNNDEAPDKVSVSVQYSTGSEDVCAGADNKVSLTFEITK
ncbi:MAG: BspA family leucine-rich repeat surface protein [Bacteroidales bacterium]